jgi:hypothetical protein
MRYISAYTKNYSSAKTVSYIILLLLVFILSACTVNFAPIEVPGSTIVSEGILNESFSSLGDWVNYDEDGLFIDVVDGHFQIESSWPGKFVWSSNYKTYSNTIIESDINWLSDDEQGMAGIMCRGQNDGNGYYALVSYTGQYSIRRLGINRDDALRRWQGHAAIPSNGQAIKMRVVCVENFIGLYINGQYIDGAEDTFFGKGNIALVAGLPPAAAGDTIRVEFDNLRVWDAAFK